MSESEYIVKVKQVEFANKLYLRYEINREIKDNSNVFDLSNFKNRLQWMWEKLWKKRENYIRSSVLDMLSLRCLLDNQEDVKYLDTCVRNSIWGQFQTINIKTNKNT